MDFTLPYGHLKKNFFGRVQYVRTDSAMDRSTDSTTDRSTVGT